MTYFIKGITSFLYLFVYLFIYLFIYLSIYLFILFYLLDFQVLKGTRVKGAKAIFGGALCKRRSCCNSL